ncbi:nuclear transport factor 2 family protein [Paraburkholderia sp. ZP32-5]|uniref:nuclear transport factor 2 family protein n=1 Tax=Paraburkholderia sp. ZP32-5 TaxID=2883245 RepID=UPI001F375A69|nr:nuclear transport factor 2 family protein [Paraburkholderia sp. ZP32-5]
MSAADDKDSIRELLARYCFLLDDYRLSEFAALFAADGTWSSRNGTATGPRAIEQLLTSLVPVPGPGTRRRHLTTNILIDLRGDTATVRSYFMVVRDSANGPAIAVAGRYEDEVVRVDGQWFFQSRRLSHDIAGESGLLPAGGPSPTS